MRLDFKLDSKTIETLLEYSELLKRPPEILIKEALEEYFVKIEKEFMQKGLEEQHSQTNLSFDEFWDGVDL